LLANLTTNFNGAAQLNIQLILPQVF